jgi:hypothetical protein
LADNPFNHFRGNCICCFHRLIKPLGRCPSIFFSTIILYGQDTGGVGVFQCSAIVVVMGDTDSSTTCLTASDYLFPSSNGLKVSIFQKSLLISISLYNK